MTCQQNNCRCIQLGPTFLRFWRHDFSQSFDSRIRSIKRTCQQKQLQVWSIRTKGSDVIAALEPTYNSSPFIYPFFTQKLNPFVVTDNDYWKSLHRCRLIKGKTILQELVKEEREEKQLIRGGDSNPGPIFSMARQGSCVLNANEETCLEFSTTLLTLTQSWLTLWIFKLLWQDWKLTLKTTKQTLVRKTILKLFWIWSKRFHWWSLIPKRHSGNAKNGFRPLQWNKSHSRFGQKSTKSSTTWNFIGPYANAMPTFVEQTSWVSNAHAWSFSWGIEASQKDVLRLEANNWRWMAIQGHDWLWSGIESQHHRISQQQQQQRRWAGAAAKLAATNQPTLRGWDSNPGHCRRQQKVFATLLLHFVSHFLILDPGSPGKGFPAPYQYQWNENWTVLRLNNKQQFEGGENVTPIDATRAWRSRWRGRHINDSSDKKIKQRGRQINYILNEFHLTRSRLSGNFQDTERPSWAGCEFFPMKGVDGRDFRASPKFQRGVGFRHWNRTDQLFSYP